MSLGLNTLLYGWTHQNFLFFQAIRTSCLISSVVHAFGVNVPSVFVVFMSRPDQSCRRHEFVWSFFRTWSTSSRPSRTRSLPEVRPVHHSGRIWLPRLPTTTPPPTKATSAWARSLAERRWGTKRRRRRRPARRTWTWSRGRAGWSSTACRSCDETPTSTFQSSSPSVPPLTACWAKRQNFFNISRNVNFCGHFVTESNRIRTWSWTSGYRRKRSVARDTRPSPS